MKQKKEKTGCSIPAVKPSEPESSEDWERDLKIEEKMFQARLTQHSLLHPHDHGGCERTRSLGPNASPSFQSQLPVSPFPSFSREESRPDREATSASRLPAAASVVVGADQRYSSNVAET